MIDTIKVAVPLTKGQHKRIYEFLADCDTWQFAKFNLHQGEIDLRRIRGLAEADQPSFHRGIMFDIQPRWNEETSLIMEFSIPKFWAGHNVHLLYDWYQALEHLKNLLEQQFHLKRMKLPQPSAWQLLRVDFCYAWRFPSQQYAQAYLNNLKTLKFPYKEPVIRKHSIFWGGDHATYAVKVYLKLPEFEVHDMKELLKQKASLEWVNYLQNLAQGVLRFEVTCRRKYLQRRSLKTVGDIMANKSHVIWDETCSEYTEQERAVFFISLSLYLQHDEQKRAAWNGFLLGQDIGFESGTHLSLPADTYHIQAGTEKTLTLEHRGGGFRIYRHGQSLETIREMLKKFVGEGDMHSDSQVQQALMSKYKPNKAARLTAFWVYCQRFGLENAKETFGKESYYQARSDLKAAGISLIERPENVMFLDDEFRNKFRMKAPSEYVANTFDDFRESANILNLRKEA